MRLPIGVPWMLILTAFILTAPAPTAYADASSQARRAIQAIYDGQNAAGARRDVNGLLAHVSPRYVSLDTHGGRHTLAGERQQANKVFSSAPRYLGRTQIQAITLTGASANVRVKEHKEMIVIYPPTKKFAIITYDTVGVDTWVRHGKSWLLTRSQTLSAQGRFNGHPILQ